MIKYAFENHGIESKDYLLTENYAEKTVSAQELIALLVKDGVNCASSQLMYYNKDKAVYHHFLDAVSVDGEFRFIIRTTEFADAMSRIEALERQIAMLSQRSDSISVNSFQKHDSLSVTPDENDLDLAVLHAAPLIMQDNGAKCPLPDSNLGFETEKRALVDFFRTHDLGLDLKFEAATLSNLIDFMELQPKLLQIDCHGIFSYDCSRFSLAFERSYEIGVLDKVNCERLAKSLGYKKNGEMIVLVNACYSEAIGSVFIEAGIPCVIAVHNECKIMDEAARIFEKEFYKGLFKGNSIKSAFLRAQAMISAEQRQLIEACCCAHQHKSNCAWLKEARSTNTLKAHSLHNSKRCCYPAKKNLCEHDVNCKWALWFVDKYCDQYAISVEDQAKGSFVVCCCSPELPHDEGMKYKLLPANSPFHDKVMFPENQKRSVEVRNSYSRLTPPFVGKLTCGRHNLIYSLVQFLSRKSDVRCVSVYGESRIGKSTVVKRAAQYCFERHCFQDGVVYVDVTGRTFFDYFFSQMEKELQLGDIKNEKDLRTIIKRFNMLIIIDGMDSILEHDEGSVRKVITYLLENTECPKLVVVSQRRFLLDSAPPPIAVGPLETADAAALLYSLAGDYLGKNVTLESLEKHIIWDTIGSSPASVHLIAPLLKEKSLEMIVAEHLAKHQEPENKSAALQIIVDNLEQNASALELFKLLCHFPYGLFREDVRTVCEDVVSNWEVLLDYLVREKNNVQRGSWCVKRIENCYETRRDICYEARRDISNYLSAEVPFRDHVFRVVSLLARIARSLVRCVNCSEADMTADAKNDMFTFDASLDKGIWAAQTEVGTDEYAVESVTACFERHERNFQHYTSMKSLERLYPDRLPDDLVPYISEIMTCLSSLYIMLGRDNLLVTGYLEQCLITCEKYCLKRENNVLKLIRASVLYADMKNADRALEQIQDCFTEEDCKEGEAECYLFRALIKYYCSVSRSDHPNVLRRHNTSEDDLKSDIRLAKAGFKDVHNDLGVARAILLKSEFKKQLTIKANYLEHLQEAINTFKSHHKKTWEIRASMLQLDFQIRTKVFEQARKTSMEILTLATNAKNKVQERIVNEKIELLFSEIQKGSRNVFSFFKSFPLVKRGHAGEFVRAGAICRFPSSFREELLNSINECNKVIHARFDIATRKNLRNCIESGTRVLHISSEEFAEGSLYLENEDGSSDIVTVADLSDQLFSNRLGIDRDKHGIEVVVLALQSSVELAKVIHHTLRIPHVIGIEFRNYPLDGETSHTQKIYQDAINKFCKHFYVNLIKELTVREAFQQACNRMEESVYPDRFILQENSQDEYDCNIDVVQGGPVLIDKNEPIHDRKLFTSSHSSIFHTEVRLQEGAFQDLSPPRAFTNVKKLDSFTGRQLLLYHTIKDLKTNRFVHIAGQAGSGKTSFLHYAGYHLCARHKYSDGIYYIDAGQGKSINENLRDLHLISSVEQLNDLVGKNDLLLLLDNCDGLIQRSLNQFQSLLSQLVNKYEISVLMTSSIDMPHREGLDCKKKLSPLSCDECAAMILSLHSSWPKDKIDPNHQYSSLAKALADDPRVKASFGLPKKIKEVARRLWEGISESEETTSLPSDPPSRKPSMEVVNGDELVEGIHAFIFTRENSKSEVEETKGDIIQDQMENQMYKAEKRKRKARE